MGPGRRDIVLGQFLKDRNLTAWEHAMRHSIVNYRQVTDASPTFRCDADFFHPDSLALHTQLENLGARPLRNWQVSVKHPKEIARRYVEDNAEDGVVFLRAQNVRPLAIDLAVNTVRITRDDARILRDNALQRGDVLLTRTGANCGQCAIFQEDMEAVASSHTFIMQSGALNPFLLAVFLNTRYGQALIAKGRYGSAQPEIAPPYLLQIPVPAWHNLAPAIEEVCVRSHELLSRARACYAGAQTRLLAELGLRNWRPQHRLTFVRQCAEIRTAGRLDSDYFQPRYDEIVSAIQHCPGDRDTLGNLVTLQKGVEVGREAYQEAGIPFVRVSNVQPFEITAEKYISEHVYADLAHHQPVQGDILLTKDATPGLAHYLREPPPRMIPASGVLRLQRRDDKLDADYLTVVLNSLLTCQQARRDAGGSIIIHWRPDQVQDTTIPLLPDETQIGIQRMAATSFALHAQSRRLLESAVQAVEVAIERDERAALGELEAARATRAENP